MYEQTNAKRHYKNEAVAYIRVSTENQGESGIGLETQIVQIKTFTEARGLRITDVFREVASAMGEEGAGATVRPRWLAAIGLALRKNCPLVVASVDRFSRNTEVVKRVVSSRLKLISVEDGGGLDNATLLAKIAGAQRRGELIGERTRRGLADAKRRGKLLGNRRNLDEARRKAAASRSQTAHRRLMAIKPIVEQLYVDGVKTPAAIAAGLNREGLLTPRGLSWTANNVRPSLRRLQQLNENNPPDWGAF